MGNLTAGALLRQIFHPCDFSHSSEVAFDHALKIALGTGAGLTMMHTATVTKIEATAIIGLRRLPAMTAAPIVPGPIISGMAIAPAMCCDSPRSPSIAALP